MRLFRSFLDHGWPLPPFLAHISVNTVLRFAEKEYVVPQPFDGQALLFRATRKSSAFDGTLIDDTPYRDLFGDPLLGWEGKTTRGLHCFDIPAGHSSMLQDPHVDLIAAKMQAHMDAVFAEEPAVPCPALVNLSERRERPRTKPDELHLAARPSDEPVDLPDTAILPGRI